MRRIALTPTAHVEVHDAIDPACRLDRDAVATLAERLRGLEFEQFRLFGKLCTAKCKRASYLRHYDFAGLRHPPIGSLPAQLEQMHEWIKVHYPRHNQCLLNLYDDDMYLGQHADDERGMVPNEPILTFGFGATRAFRITRNNKKVTDVQSAHNSLIVMAGSMQKSHKHGIPPRSKRALPAGPRVSVTWRAFHS